MKFKSYVYLFTMIGFALSACDYALYQEIQEEKTMFPQEETADFFTYMLPSLLAFVAGLSHKWAEKVCAVVMIIGGTVVLFVLENLALSVMTSLTYIMTGYMILAATDY